MAEVIYVQGAVPPVNQGEARVIDEFERRLPDSFRIFPGVQIVHRGATDDVDVLVLTDHCLVIVEVKDIRGNLYVDNGDCYVNDSPRPQPFLVTSSKARRLKSRLVDSVPLLESLWVAPLVVLADTPAGLKLKPESLKKSIVSIDRAIEILTDPEALVRPPYEPLGQLTDMVVAQLNLTRGRKRDLRFGPYRCTELRYRNDDEDLWSATHSLTDEQVELRHIGRNPATRTQRVKEAEGELVALRAIGDHPSIDGPIGVLPQDDGSIVLIHEPAQGPTLAELLEADQEIPADRVVLDVASAIAHAHENGVVHRRLSPRWIEVRPEHAVVKGFSLSPHGGALPAAATVLLEEDATFLAPEVRNRQQAGKPADVYSLGKLIRLLKPDDHLMARLGDALGAEATGRRVLPYDRYVLDALWEAYGIEPNKTAEAAEPAAPSYDEAGRLEPGSPAGPYVVVERLGSGGFSDVYRVRDVFGKDFALKVFRHERAEDLIQFEYAVLQRIDDPRVVRVVHAGHGPIGWYMVSEYLDGERLDARIDHAGDTTDVGEALLIGYEILDALSTVHGQQVVHRDVKPENVILVEGRGAVLYDFGVAAAEGGQIDGLTFAYWPPGVAKDSRSIDIDLFAAGLVICELLTGAHPYPDRNPHGGAQPDLSGLPAALQPILGRAVNPDPAARYTSADEFKAQLEDFVDTTRPISVSRRDLHARLVKLIAQGAYEEAWVLCPEAWKRMRARIASLRRADQTEKERIAGVDVSYLGESTDVIPSFDSQVGRLDATTWTYHVEGKHGLMLDIRIAELANGEVQVATSDAYESHDWFQGLVNRLRLGAYHEGERWRTKLPYIYFHDERGRPAQRFPDRDLGMAEISQRAGVDVTQTLLDRGATSIGWRLDLFPGSPKGTRNEMTLLIPDAERNELLAVAYLLTAVVPLGRELGLLLDQGS